MQRLKELIDAGIARHGSVGEFAAVVGVHPNSIAGYKAGTRPMSVEMHARIAEAAGLTDSQVRDYSWSVLRERLGKITEKAIVLLAFGVSMVVGFAQPAEAAGLRKIDNVYTVEYHTLSFASDRQYRFC